MKRKILLTLILAATLIALFAISVSAAEPVKVWDISATENDSVTATLYDDYSLVISGTGNTRDCYPEYAPWYSSYRSAITSVTIDKGVTSIGSYMFQYCTSLTSVGISDSVTSIGALAFYQCYSLTSVEIPNSVTSIGWGTFYNCNRLTSVAIPNSVVSIVDRTFSDCFSLTSVEIPNSVTSIGDYAFYDCRSLTSMEIPNSVTNISTGAFYECSSLTSVEIPNSVTSMGNNAFGECRSLISVKIPNSVKSVGEYAFFHCISLIRVVMGDSITSIGYRAFEKCLSLTSVEIGNGVTSIGERAFYDCSNLTIYCEASSQPSGWSTSWNSSNRPVVWDYKNVMQGEIFTFKGYSFNEAGSIAIGFDIDYEAIALYEELTGEKLEIGVVFAGYELLNGQNPLDNQGNAIALASGKVIKSDLSNYSYTTYDFMLTDVTDAIKDIPLVIAAYINNGQETKYVQSNGISDTVSGISYNEAKENN